MSCSDSVTNADADALHAMQDRLVPDTLHDDGENVLSSFADIKHRTMRDLYGEDGNDKSPKGSVDVLIQPLVNLLNVHHSFATLSSCSGRIALFDPNMTNNEQEESMEESNHSQTERGSGKGRGVWMLASHEEVEPWTLVSLLDEQSGEAASRETLMFKHEPLLLHVAASSLTRGRQLLNLALRMGFRESGLVVTERRVTVAIRGHSLALTVPLARQGPLRPSPAYLEGLIKEANMRMRSNHEKLNRLYQTLQEALFRPAGPKPQQVLNATVSELPPLNLWGHAAVAVPVGTNDDVDVIVFGGYGEGPELEGSTLSSQGKRCCRSNSVYSLRRRNGAFNESWREIRRKPLTQQCKEIPILSNLGVEVVSVDFTPRESLDACLLPTLSSAVMSVVALWGGRASPGKPFDDLLLYEPFAVAPFFTKPTDIRGQRPEARFGHSFTALTGDDGLMAVLVGGRNERAAFGSIHVLSLIESDSGVSHFHWAKLDLGLPFRFQHTTVAVDNSVFVFGGLSDPNDLLSSFSDSRSSQPGILGFHVDSQGVALFDEKDVGSENMGNLGACTGGAGCVMTAPASSGDIQTLIVLTGGVPSNVSGSEHIQWCEVVSGDRDVALVSRREIQIYSTGLVDFGSMVHHCCVSLPSPKDYSDVVLVGGGVSSFAFGPSFAE
jgi:tRNA wybutosine-synthesizing protein 3